VSVERLDMTAHGQVRYCLKTPYRDGTTHIVLEPLDFVARLAALVPPPRVHLTRFHGVFAANATMRPAVTPAGRGAQKRRLAAPEQPTPKDIRLNWARRLKRVFGIEIEQCALRRTPASDREHRGAGADRAHSRAPSGAGRGGDADGLARCTSAAAELAVLISWTSLMLTLSRCEQRAVLRAVTSRRALDPCNG
jgi:hypothetical protein